MKQKIDAIVMSKEEILATLSNIEMLGSKTYGILKSNPKLGSLELPDWLWTLCGSVIEVNDTANQTHQFDFNYFDYPKECEDRTEIPIIYFMEEWLAF